MHDKYVLARKAMNVRPFGARRQSGREKQRKTKYKVPAKPEAISFVFLLTIFISSNDRKHKMDQYVNLISSMCASERPTIQDEGLETLWLLSLFLAAVNLSNLSPLSNAMFVGSL